MVVMEADASDTGNIMRWSREKTMAFIARVLSETIPKYRKQYELIAGNVIKGF